jgi:outer membrane receptor protein involved in Fe transport
MTPPRRTLGRASIALALALAPAAIAGVVSVTSSAHADDVADEAELQFQLGAERYKAGDYLGALEHFLASNRLSPNPNVLFNVARCYEHLGRYPDAFRAYVLARERASANANANASFAKQIDEAIARIAPRVAVLDVRSEPAGATIYLDRKDLGARGSAPRLLGLAPGKYRVLAELPGYELATSDEIVVAEGSRTVVSLKLKPLLATVNVKGDDPSVAGAEVRADRDDGEPVCIAPCALTLPPGKHSLRLRREGYRPLEIPLDLAPREQRAVSPQLAVLTGTVVVDADLKDALIEVDGKSSGFTPSVLQVPVGRHVVRVSRPGYRAIERKVLVATDREQKLDLHLADAQEVTAASRSTETIDEAPASVSIVPGIELRAMGYPTIAEALRGVRGVSVTDDRAYSSLGVRGFAPLGNYGNRVLVTIDGQPTNDNYIGSSYVGFDGRVDLEDVDRIEVVRGPGSALYGTSAFFGVVNLVTRGRDAPTHVEAGISAAEYGVSRARVHGTWKGAGDYGAWTSVSLAWSPDGRSFTFPEFASTTPPTSDGRAVGLDGFRAGTVSGRAWWKALTLQWFYTDRSKALPTAVTETIFGSPDTRYRDRRAFLELRWDAKVANDVVLASRLHANVYAFDDTLAYGPVDGGNLHESFRGVWGGLEERVAFPLGAWANVTVGGEAQRHFQTHQLGVSDDGTTVIDRDDPFWIGAAYAVVDLKPDERVRISPAVRVDTFSTFGTSANPRLSVVTRPWTGAVAKVFVGRAFRAPSVYELYYVSDVQTPGGDLKPEDVWSSEIELSQRLSRDLIAIASGYVNRVGNLIVLIGDGVTTNKNQYVNLPNRVQTVGGELELRRELRDGWMLSGQVSVQKTRYLDDTEKLREVPNSPWILAGLRGVVPIVARALVLSSRASLIGPAWDRNYRSTDPAQEQTRAAIVWDLVFSGQVEGASLRWNFGVYNLLDSQWSAPVSGEHRQRVIPQNGRTLYASLGTSF